MKQKILEKGEIKNEIVITARDLAGRILEEGYLDEVLTSYEWEDNGKLSLYGPKWSLDIFFLTGKIIIYGELPFYVKAFLKI